MSPHLSYLLSAATSILSPNKPIIISTAHIYIKFHLHVCTSNFQIPIIHHSSPTPLHFSHHLTFSLYTLLPTCTETMHVYHTPSHTHFPSSPHPFSKPIKPIPCSLPSSINISRTYFLSLNLPMHGHYSVNTHKPTAHGRYSPHYLLSLIHSAIKCTPSLVRLLTLLTSKTN